MRVGILGCGQLARMLSLAGYPLGIETLSLVADPQLEANGVTPIFLGSFNNSKDVQTFAKQVDVITYETENIPVFVAEQIQNFCPIFPQANILAIAQDRLYEKQCFKRLNIKTAPFIPIYSLDDLESAVKNFGFPSLLKTCRFGYDGKGQYLIRNQNDIQAAWHTLKTESLILEGFIDFQKEVSIIAVRNAVPEIYFYSIIENEHRNGILYTSKVPIDDNALQQQAQSIAEKIMQEYKYIGVLAIEFFVKDNELIANEMAPRVHNSGHWTIEGAVTSQFENHLRAICALPLGNTKERGYSAMINCIGQMPPIAQVLQYQNVHYHDYGKSPRLNRKLGHVTLNEIDAERFQDQFLKLRQFIKINNNYHGN